MVAGWILGIHNYFDCKSSSLFTRINYGYIKIIIFLIFSYFPFLPIFPSKKILTSLAESVQRLPSKQLFIGSTPIGC